VYILQYVKEKTENGWEGGSDKVTLCQLFAKDAPEPESSADRAFGTKAKPGSLTYFFKAARGKGAVTIKNNLHIAITQNPQKTNR
jgi:hypothetical protein